jgi:hypothetical protein
MVGRESGVLLKSRAHREERNAVLWREVADELLCRAPRQGNSSAAIAHALTGVHEERNPAGRRVLDGRENSDLFAAELTPEGVRGQPGYVISIVVQDVDGNDAAISIGLSLHGERRKADDHADQRQVLACHGEPQSQDDAGCSSTA